MNKLNPMKKIIVSIMGVITVIAFIYLIKVATPVNKQKNIVNIQPVGYGSIQSQGVSSQPIPQTNPTLKTRVS